MDDLIKNFYTHFAKGFNKSRLPSNLQARHLVRGTAASVMSESRSSAKQVRLMRKSVCMINYFMLNSRRICTTNKVYHRIHTLMWKKPFMCMLGWEVP